MSDSLQQQWTGYQCPKCEYRRQPDETVSVQECPRCGVIYAKAMASTRPQYERGSQSPKQKQALWLGQKPGELLAGIVSLVVIVVIYLIIQSDDNAISAEHKAAKKAEQAEQRTLETVAMRSCEAKAKAAATHPGTVSVQWFQGVFVEPHNSGNTMVKMNFTAKNAFGAEHSYLITCLVDHSGEVVSSRVEQR